ncbi:MAG TPA: hypothetical protein LFV90_01255 [Rickettsia endosymbiont of Columbicola hoogstraali]|nr:hypothetical protein [Rickettsia endosymbiont of Columbicola hoogstraali]
MNNIVEKRITLIEPYLDFIIKSEELLREIYPNGIDRDLIIEFILAKKPYKSYAYYTLIRSLFKSPCNKIILIIDKQLQNLSWVYSALLSSVLYHISS